jgi:hypothetical protein
VIHVEVELYIILMRRNILISAVTSSSLTAFCLCHSLQRNAEVLPLQNHVYPCRSFPVHPTTSYSVVLYNDCVKKKFHPNNVWTVPSFSAMNCISVKIIMDNTLCTNRLCLVWGPTKRRWAICKKSRVKELRGLSPRTKYTDRATVAYLWS